MRRLLFLIVAFCVFLWGLQGPATLASDINHADPCEMGKIGTVCADGAVYAGMVDTRRIYAAPNDERLPLPWNNGSYNFNVVGANSTVNGKENTDRLIGAYDDGWPYRAAAACRAKGENWYLPALSEVLLLHKHMEEIGGFAPSSWYSTSTEVSASTAIVIWFKNSLYSDGGKAEGYMTRCVRYTNNER